MRYAAHLAIRRNYTPTTVTTAGAIEVHFVQGATLMRAFSANGKRSVRRGRLCVSTWIAASALVGIYIWRKRQLNDRMHKWEVTATQDEESFFDDHIETIIASDEALPPREQSLGETAVRWDRVGKDAFIQAQGGSVDDRILARAMVAEQLASFGIHEAAQTLDAPSFEKTAEWNDIMDKARRLIQDGNVRILRNGYNNVVGYVKGDHGEYQTEIFRQDPNSRAITMSDCECGWGEFQNQPRTRQWKRYQDRPCSHILATYWLAQATPLDEDAHPAMGDQGASQGQGQPGAQPGAMPPGGPQGAPQGAPAPMGPQQGIPPVSQPGIPPQGGPSPADVLPQFQTEPPDIQPQNPSSVPGLRGPTPTNPINYPPGPGGTFSSWHEAMPYHVSPTDRRQQILEQGLRQDAPRVNQDSEHDPGVYVWDDPDVAWKYRGQGPNMYRDMDVWHVNTEGMDLQRDPWFDANHQNRAEDFPGGWYHPGDIPRERVSPHFLDPWTRSTDVPELAGYYAEQERKSREDEERLEQEAEAQRLERQQYFDRTFASLRQGKGLDVVAFEIAESNGQVWLTPSDAINRDHHVGGVSEGDEQTWIEVGSAHVGNRTDDLASQGVIEGVDVHGWRVAADDTMPEVPEQDPRLTAPLVNGQMVQLRYPDTGIQQGRSEAHGAGQQTQLPAGLVGEVLGTDPTTGMVSVLYVGKPWEQNREFEPFGATGEHWRSYLIHRPDVKRPGPAYRRTR